MGFVSTHLFHLIFWISPAFFSVQTYQFTLSAYKNTFRQGALKISDSDSALLWGGWSNYQPVVFRNRMTRIDTPNNQFIAAIQDRNGKIFFAHTLTISPEDQTIRHNYQITCRDKKFPLHFEPNHLEYEGKWAFFYVYVDEPTLNIRFGAYLNSEERSFLVTDNDCFQVLKQAHEIIVGNTKLIEGIQFSAFTGYLGVILSEKVIDYIQYFDDQLQSLREDCVTLRYPSLQSSKRSTINFRLEEGFSFSFWYKSDLTTSDLVAIYIPGIYDQNDDIIGYKIIEIIYHQLGEPLLMLQVDKLRFPYFYKDELQMIEDFEKVRMVLTSEFVSKWHFISYRYFLATLHAEIELISLELNERFYEQIENIPQYKSDQYNLVLNGDERDKKQMLDFSFFSCLRELKYSCMPTCQDCVNPLECTVCDETKGFVFKLETKTCECPEGYLVTEDYFCKQFEISVTCTSTEKSIEASEPEIICQHGYFLYEQECYSCPTAMNNALTCFECLQYWKNWVSDPFCTQEYSHESITFPDSFITYSQKVQFVFQNEQLELCEHCSAICIVPGLSCKLSSYTHMDTQALIKCTNDAEFDERSRVCKRKANFQQIIKFDKYDCGYLHCNKNCKCCRYDGCAYCRDPQRYFLSLNRFDCIECNIPNCKYCFAHLVDDLKINSLQIQEQSYAYSDAIVNQCALCNTDFSTNLFEHKCVTEIHLSDCQLAIVSADNKQYCIDFEPKNVDFPQYQVMSCLKYLKNCKVCADIFNCITCNDGYFRNLESKCSSCNSIDPNSITCEPYSSLHQDLWKLDLYSLARHIDYDTMEMVQNRPEDQILSLTCDKGYQVRTSNHYCNSISQSCYLGNQEIEKSDCNNRFAIKKNEEDQCQKYCKLCWQASKISTPKTILSIISSPDASQRSGKQCLQSQDFRVSNKDGQLIWTKSNLQNCYNKISFLYNSIEQYENQFWKQSAYLKELGINEVEIKISLASVDNPHQIFITTGLDYLLQLTKIELILDCEFKYVQLLYSFIIEWFTHVTIINCNFQVQIPAFQIRSPNGLYLKIQASSFYKNSMMNFGFLFSALIDLKFENVKLVQLILQDTKIFQLVFLTDSTEKNKMFISFLNFEINQSQFTKCELIEVNGDNILESFEFQQVSLKNSIFSQLLFFDNQRIQSTVELKIRQIIIQSCQFREAILFQLLTHVQLESTIIQDSKFMRSKFLSIEILRAELVMNIANFLVSNSKFDQSNLISSLSTTDLSGTVYLSHIKLQQILLDKSDLFQIVSKANYYFRQIIVTNIGLVDSQKSCIFKLQGWLIQLETLEIYSRNEAVEITLEGFDTVLISGLLYNGQIQTQGQLTLSRSCLSSSQEKLNMLAIVECRQVSIQEVQIQNVIWSDTVLFRILSVRDGEQDQELSIRNFSFTNVLMLKLDQNKQSLIIQISSNRLHLLQISDLTLKQIWYNGYFFNQQEQASAILYFNAIHAQMLLSNITITRTYVSNSKISFLKASADKVTVKNLSFYLINQLSDELSILLQFPYQQFVIDKYLPLVSNEPLIKILATNSYITQLEFREIRNYQGAILQIEGSSKSEINIIDTYFSKIFCLSNYCQSTCLDLTLMGQESQVRIDSLQAHEIISIQGSIFHFVATRGIFSFNQIYLRSCYALQSCVLTLSVEGNSISTMKFSNFILKNDVDKLLIETFNIFNQLIDGIKIESIKAMMNIEKANVRLKNFKVSGIVFGQLMLINEFQSVIFDGGEFNGIIGLSDYLVHFQSLAQGFVKVERLKLKNVRYLSTAQSMTMQLVMRDQVHLVNICNSTVTLKQQQLQKLDSIDQIMNSMINKGKEICIICISTPSAQLKLKNIVIISNSCSGCQFGNLGILSFQSAILLAFKVSRNICGSEGCLYVANKSSNIHRESLKIKDSYFTQNYAKYGGALYVTNDQLYISDSYFIKNTAEIGGALYCPFEIDLHLQETSFFQNQAKNTGSIHLTKSYLNSKIAKLSLLQNKASQAVDNIREVPTKLVLLYDETMLFGNDFSDETSIGSIYNQSIIYFPSGQAFQDYQNYHSNKVMQTSIIAITNLNEQIVDLFNTSCILQSRLFDSKTLQPLTDFETNKHLDQKTIQFEENLQSYSLDSLKIYLDPYLADSTVLQIQAVCNSTVHPHYRFLFNVKTFPCYPGEFYQENLCKPCLASNQEYSVSFKATSCRKVNPLVIKNFTRSSLELLPGFWRPEDTSEDIEECYQEAKNCLGGWEVNYPSCRRGHIGALCEECDLYDIRGDGQYQKDSNFNCYQCGQENLVAFYASLSVIWIVISTMMAVDSHRNQALALKNIRLFQKQHRILQKFQKDLSGSLIKMSIGYLQIVTSLEKFRIKLNILTFRFLFSFTNATESFSYSLDCSMVLGTSIPITNLKIIQLITLQFLYFFISTLSLFLVSLIRKQDFNSGDIISAFLYIFLVSSPSLIQELGALISYRRISNYNWIQSNISYRYDHQHEQIVLTVFIPIFILFGVIIPLFITLVIRTIKSNKTLYEKWSLYFNEFKSASYYWETIRIVQRELIIICLTLFYDYIIIKGIIIFIVIWTYLQIVLRQQPYDIKAINDFELVNLNLCGKITLFAVLLYSSERSQLRYLEPILEGCLIISFLLLIYNLIAEISTSYMKKYEDKLDNLRIKMINKYPNIARQFPAFFQPRKNMKQSLKEKLITCKMKIINSIRNTRQGVAKKSVDQIFSFILSPQPEMKNQLIEPGNI